MAIARNVLLRASRSAWLAEQARRRTFARRAVRRFMPGEALEDALSAASELAGENIGTVLTQLGERVESSADAVAVHAHYAGVLDEIVRRRLPALVSVKLTHLGLDASAAACRAHLLDLAARAGAAGSLLWVDMEESWYVERTIEQVLAARAEGNPVGVCLQAALHRTPDDMERLLDAGVAVRLVKGAYAEPESIALPRGEAVNARYRQLAERLLERRSPGLPRPVFGTHDLRLVEHVRRAAAAMSLPQHAFEVHMLYGVRSAAQRELAGAGVAVRVLISYGTAWFPWFMRRLAERPANVWLLVRSLAA